MNSQIKNISLLVFLFSISTFTSIAQDDCASAIPIPTLDGTNCPSTTSSSTNSLAAGSCEEGINDTWFSFVAQGGTADFTVTGPGGFRPEYLILSEPTNSCAGTYTLEDCADGIGSYGGLTGTTTGLIPGNTYWVVVSSGNGSSGTITVCVDNPATAANCVDNEECASAQVLTLNATSGGALCLTDCNTGATPGLDFTGTVCEDQLNQTVWYEFTTDGTAATIDVSLTSSVLNDPEFTVFLGNSCVTTWTVTNCTEGSGGSATATSIPVATNQTYVIAVSDQNGAEGNFDLCITQNPDNSACNTNNAMTVTATSMGSPLTGPYLPGEDVTFCYTVTDWTQINCNYIGAFVPTFGNCWEASSFDPQGQPSNIVTPLNVNGVIAPGTIFDSWWACQGTASGTWNWFTAGSATYNINGYYPAGTPMPAGWYFLSSYSPATGNCAPDPTDPDNTYGDGNFPACGTVGLDYTVCFTLTAGDLATTCTAGSTDCSVSMKTFADGEFGAWVNLGCTADGVNSVPNAIDCFTALPIELINFDAVYNSENKIVDLNWTTASEINNDFFEVQKSIDGINFEILETTKGMGTSNIETNYSARDNNINFGMIYYRLRQVDFDGKHSYSDVQAINIQQEFDNTLTVHPNPSNGETEALFNSYGAEEVNLTITSFDGKQVFNRNYNAILGGNRLKFNASEFKKGVYIITVRTTSKVYTTKLVKK